LQEFSHIELVPIPAIRGNNLCWQSFFGNQWKNQTKKSAPHKRGANVPEKEVAHWVLGEAFAGNYRLIAWVHVLDIKIKNEVLL
jgi:hypothetical protein